MAEYRTSIDIEATPECVFDFLGFTGSETLPPGASTVSFTLTPISVGTRVEVVHTDLPEDDLPGHAAGWEHFLPRLARAATGAQLPPDTWAPAR